MAQGIRGLVLLAVVALLLRTWCVQGLWPGLQISGGSMAPTLVGFHREVTCRDCGCRFDCGADAAALREENRPAVCPNCDYGQNDLRNLPILAGQHVVVCRPIYRIRRPRRWELVAFHHPHDPRQVCVKRVVGLPGESVQIRDGEVYVDGQIARKPLAKQRAMAVLVCDADWTPKRNPALSPRWQSEREGAWGSTDGRFAHAWIEGSQTLDWLTYRHWHRVPGTAGQVREGPITNRYAYNHDRPLHPSSLFPVGDVMLSFELSRAFGSGGLLVRATDGPEEFLARLDLAEGRYELFENSKPVASGGGLPRRGEGLQFEVSLFDRQFLLAIDDRLIVCRPFASAMKQAPPAKPTSRPFAIGSQGLGVAIRHVRVYRDVHYTRPLGLQGRWGLERPVVLGSDEYFVLGDNSSISSDSRTWPEGPAVPARLLLGKPFLAAGPARRIELGPWHFQVPDPTEIRYIQ